MNAIIKLLWENCEWSTENAVEGKIDKIKSARKGHSMEESQKTTVYVEEQRLGDSTLDGAWQYCNTCSMMQI